MTFRDLFEVAGYVIPVVESAPYWLSAALFVAVVAGVWRCVRRDRFQHTAAEAARAPLPTPVKPVVETRPGSNQEALATCNAILYVTNQEQS